jgi:DNA-binding response OmpR family regulator
VGATIVLADDEPELRAIYSTYLRAEGHEVYEAADGLEAVALVAERKPALLILDVWMPNLNGFEVLERLRDLPASARLKVVMMSNLGDSDTRLEGFSIGVCDYWIKGLSLSELKSRIDRLVAGNELTPDPN